MRALTKKGLEHAFVNKLEMKLKSAVNGLNSQRRAELKEREEEEIANRRREEEADSLELVATRKLADNLDWENFENKLAGMNMNEPIEVVIDANGVGTGNVNFHNALTASFISKNYTETIDLLTTRFPKGEKKTDALWLMQAKAFSEVGDFNQALHASGVLIQNSASHSRGGWQRGEERLMAVTLGANAAMVLGKSEIAVKYYQAVLKYDPDNKLVMTQYKLLKKVIKIIAEAEKEITKGYNKKGIELIYDALSKIKGLDVDSLLFRSVVILMLGRAESSMNKHEEAIEHLDFVVQTRENEKSCSQKLLMEAFGFRAEANVLDDSYDDAVSDFRSAMELAPDDVKRDMQMKLNEASQKRDRWNGGQKDHYYNEHRGFPDGRPPERDNIKILDLPVNLAEHPGEVACSWVRKSYKKLARKYHPDKYKGSQKRASRKFDEIAAAKKLLEEEWKCKGK